MDSPWGQVVWRGEGFLQVFQKQRPLGHCFCVLSIEDRGPNLSNVASDLEFVIALLGIKFLPFIEAAGPLNKLIPPILRFCIGHRRLSSSCPACTELVGPWPAQFFTDQELTEGVSTIEILELWIPLDKLPPGIKDGLIALLRNGRYGHVEKLDRFDSFVVDDGKEFLIDAVQENRS